MSRLQGRWRGGLRRISLAKAAPMVVTVSLLTIVLQVPHSLTPPASAAAVACAEVQRSGAWTSIVDLPGYDTEPTGTGGSLDHPTNGATEIEAWTVDPHDADRLYVVAPTIHPLFETVYAARFEGSLLRTKDGGCSWQEVLTEDKLLAAAGAPDAHVMGIRVNDVVVGDDGTIYAAVVRGSGTGRSGRGGSPQGNLEYNWGQPTVFLDSVWVSRDGGDSWTRETKGLPTEKGGSNPAYLYPAPGHPDVLYLVADTTDLYASTDGGKTWEPRSIYSDQDKVDDRTYIDDCVVTQQTPVGPCTDSSLVGKYDGGAPYFLHTQSNHPNKVRQAFAIDPLDPKQIWAIRGGFDMEEARNRRRASDQTSYYCGDLVHSRDGGSTWKRVEIDIGRWPCGSTSIKVQHFPGQPIGLFMVGHCEYVPVPTENLPRNRCSLLKSIDEGKTWRSLTTVTVKNQGTPFFYLGRRSSDVVVGDQYPPVGMWRHDPRSKSWVDVSPVHQQRKVDNAYSLQCCAPEVEGHGGLVVQDGNNTYLIVEMEYQADGGVPRVSLDKYLWPRR